MSSTTMTLALEGEVPLDLFVSAMQGWQRLLDALTESTSRDTRITWIVEELQAGSALATVRGEADDIENVARVVRAFDDVGAALARNLDVPGNAKVRDEARKLTSILDGKITALRFETPEHDWLVTNALGKQQRRRLVQAVGAIAGRVQTVSSRHALRFTLYDSAYDSAVTCYLQEGREELMRDAWNRRAIVEGLVSRDSETGRPVSIRQVERVTPIEDVAPGGFRRARGIAEATADTELPEVRIRRWRDA